VKINSFRKRTESKWLMMIWLLFVSCAESPPIHYKESEGFKDRFLMMYPVYVDGILFGLSMHSDSPGKVLIVITIPDLCSLDYPQEILFKIDGQPETITDEKTSSDCRTNLSVPRNETSRSILIGSSLIRQIDTSKVTYLRWGPYEGKIDSTSKIKASIRAFLKKADEKFL
jgi:hypothetical protein